MVKKSGFYYQLFNYIAKRRYGSVTDSMGLIFLSRKHFWENFEGFFFNLSSKKNLNFIQSISQFKTNTVTKVCFEMDLIWGIFM